MGILSSLGKKVKSITIKTLDTVSGVVTNPITAITKGTKASTKKFIEAKPSENVVKTVTNIGGAALAVAGIGAASAAAKAGTLGATSLKAAKSLIPTTTKGKIIAAVAAPIALGAVANQPVATAKAITKAPSDLANFGGNIANLAVDPSLENAKNLVKENPILTGLTGAAIVGGVGLGAASIAGNVLNTFATKENTKALKESGETPLSGEISQNLPVASSIPSSPNTPIAPQTAATQPLVAVAGSSSTKRKKRKPTQKPSINQRVNVIVSSRSSSIGIKQNRKLINTRSILN